MFKSELVLRPNCLLTRRPLVFLTGPRSLFYYQKPWQSVFYYLSEHGYKVQVIKLPFRKTADRIKYLKKILGLISKHHIFCDSCSFNELFSVLSGLNQSSLTVMSKNKNSHKLDHSPYFLNVDYKSTDLTYKIHELYLKFLNLTAPPPCELMINPPLAYLDQLLDHCVRLAELDFTAEL